MIGYALCGSFCTHARSIAALRELLARGYEVCPIVSEIVFCTDTRFGSAKERIETLEALCGQAVVHSIAGAEPFGPKTVLDLLIIAPCTGNTLAKLCAGITDSCVTMAAKAQLRADRPVLLGVATNDALSATRKTSPKSRSIGISPCSPWKRTIRRKSRIPWFVASICLRRRRMRSSAAHRDKKQTAMP